MNEWLSLVVKLLKQINELRKYDDWRYSNKLPKSFLSLLWSWNLKDLLEAGLLNMKKKSKYSKMQIIAKYPNSHNKSNVQKQLTASSSEVSGTNLKWK